MRPATKLPEPVGTHAKGREMIPPLPYSFIVSCRNQSGQNSGMVRQATSPVTISSGIPTRTKSLNL